jgi:amidohydrolase
VGVAKMLAQLKQQWHGTLMLLAQPAEEITEGAKAMLADGLYTRFPKPNFAIALHDSSSLEAGSVGLCSGFALASSTTVQITMRGAGGHASMPDRTKDPVVATAQLVLALQSIVSRENSPFDPAVVTIGSIHGGTKANIIPDDVQLQLSIRAYKEDVRQKVLAAIERTAKGTALAAGMPADRPPVVTISPPTPATYNDPKLTAQLESLFANTFGAAHVVQSPPIMGSEDFGRFGLEDHQIPTCIFWLGAVDSAKMAVSKRDGTPLPSLHSPLFAPTPEPTLKTGVKALKIAAIELLK